MSTQTNAMPEPRAAAWQAMVRPLYWSIRRELWGNRLIYLGPLSAAVVLLGAFVVHTILLRQRMHGVWPTSMARLHDLLGGPYEFAAGLIMGAAVLVGIFYCLDALYGERRDRSILFWKSLPVSDATTVLSKLLIPLAVLPLLSFAITVVTQVLMLLLSSVLLLGSGLGASTLWHHSSFLHMSLLLLYHIVTVHGLWYAPIYGWLLFISALSPRAPFVWAFLPPFLLCAGEKIAFNSHYLLDILTYRLVGPEASGMGKAGTMMDAMAALTPGQFFSTPGLWVGLAIAAAFLAGAVRLRRYKGPV